MKQLLVFLFLLCAASVSAQDVIVKKDGSTIVCRVVELTATEITYKKWSDLNGSNYVMDRSLASAINYENGKREEFSSVQNQYLPGNQNDGVQQYNDKALLKIDLAASNPYKKIKTIRTIAWLSGGAFLIAGTVSGILYRTVDYPDFDAALIFAIASTGVAVISTPTLLFIAKSKEKKINRMLLNTSLFQQDIKFGNGTSLSAGIDLLTDRTEAGRTFGSNTLGLGLRYNF